MSSCIPLALPFAAGAGAGALLGKKFGKSETAVAVGAMSGALATALFHAYVLPLGGVSGSWQLFGCAGATHGVGLVRPLDPSRFGRGLKGLGSMLDANVLTSAWYLPLVEKINNTTGARSYAWAPMKYLSNWDALSYNMGFSNYSAGIRQESTLYQWDGHQWRKTAVQSSL